MISKRFLDADLVVDGKRLEVLASRAAMDTKVDSDDATGIGDSDRERVSTHVATTLKYEAWSKDKIDPISGVAIRVAVIDRNKQYSFTADYVKTLWFGWDEQTGMHRIEVEAKAEGRKAIPEYSDF